MILVAGIEVRENRTTKRTADQLDYGHGLGEQTVPAPFHVPPIPAHAAAVITPAQMPPWQHAPVASVVVVVLVVVVVVEQTPGNS